VIAEAEVGSSGVNGQLTFHHIAHRRSCPLCRLCPRWLGGFLEAFRSLAIQMAEDLEGGLVCLTFDYGFYLK